MEELRRHYEIQCRNISTTHEHHPVLFNLAKQCESIVELGVGGAVISSWALLWGLSNNGKSTKEYVGVDIALAGEVKEASRIAKLNKINYTFIFGDDMKIALNSCDMMFIDSLHTYCHLTYELEKFSPLVKKYIVMHDTSPPWEKCDDTEYRGDYSEYPLHIDRTKRGLWAAVEDFLASHKEWKLKERRTNCYGLTVLERVKN